MVLIFQGSLLVEGRLWMACHSSCILLVSRRMLFPVLSPLILKSTGHKKDEKVRGKYIVNHQVKVLETKVIYASEYLKDHIFELQRKM